MWRRLQRRYQPAVLSEAAVAAGFGALAAWVTRPLAAHLGTRTLAGPDPQIDLWTVHWLARHLLDPARLFGGNVFHPVQHSVLFSDLSLGSAVLVAPLAWLGLDPVPLYNSAVLASLTFAGWAFHALVRTVTGSRWAGLLAGVGAAFGSHQLSHIYHLNLLTTGWLALLLLALHRLAERPAPRWVLLAGLSFALSAQSSGYYAVAAALLPVLFALARLRSWRRRSLAAAGAAALLGAALTLPYLRAFLELRHEQGLRRPPGMSVRMAFQPARDLTSVSYLYREALGSDGERLFPGLLLPALAAVALARRRPHSVFYAGACATLLLVSLGPRLELGGGVIPLPYAGLFAIPPLDSMRHPYTFAAVASFLLAVLAGIGWSGLESARRPWAGPLVVGLAIAETLAPGPAVRRVPAELPEAYRLVAELPAGPVLEIPFLATDLMLNAARYPGPLVNGDGAFRPGRHGVLDRVIRNHWLDREPDDVDSSKPMGLLLNEFPVRYIILPVGQRPWLWRLGEAFGRSRVLREVAQTGSGDRIFELVEGER